MNKRIPTLISVAFGLLIVLALGTCLFLNETLRRTVAEAKAVTEQTAKVRGSIRDLKADYLHTREEVSALVLDPVPGSEVEERLRRMKWAEASSDQLEAVALAATRSEELKATLRKLIAFDDNECDEVATKILALAGTDADAARAFYRKQYLPLEREKMKLADEALRLAFAEVAALDSKEGADMRWGEMFAYGAIILFLGTGVAGALFFRRVVAKVVDQSERATQENKEMVEHSLDVICAIDAAGNFASLNGACQRIFGYSPAELRGRAYMSLVYPDDAEKTEHAAAEVMAGAPVLDFSNRYIRKDGAVVDIMWSARWSEEHQQMFCVARDITERIAAEESLKKSEKRYRSFFDANPLPMWIYDLGTLSFLEINNAAIAHYGYGREEFLGMTIADIRPNDDKPALLAAVARAGRCAVDRIENATSWRHLKKDGSMIDVEITSQVLDYKGRSAELVMAFDITERRRSEEAVRKAEEKYRSIYENSNDGIFQNTPDGRMISANPALAKILGYASPEELVRERTDIENQGFTEPALRENFVRTLEAQGSISDFEYELRRKDGTKVWVCEHTRVVRDSEGRSLFYEGSVQDITERKRAEATRDRMSDALGESKRFAESIAENSTSTIYIFDLETRTSVYTNRNAAESLGYSPAQILEMGANFLPTIIHPEDLPRLLKQQAHFAEVTDSRVLDLEFRVKDAGGEWRWTWTRETVFKRRPNGAAWQIMGTAQDITERKKTERALWETEERFRLVARATDEAIWDWDIVANTISFSESLGNLFGYRAGEFESTMEFWMSGIHPEDHDQLMASVHAFFASPEQSWSGEYRFRCADGSYAFVYDRGIVVRDQGKPLRMVGSMMNITERKRAEEELSLSRLRLAEAQHIAQVGSWEWDVKTDALTWSEEKWRLFGRAPNECALNREFQLSCVHPEDRPTALAWIQTALTTGKPAAVDFRIVRPDAEVRVMHTRANGVFDENGQVIRVLGTSQDITEQRRTERKLHAAKTDAEAANRAKSEFLANMSHEIRTPMNGILGMTELVLESSLTEEQRSYLKMVNDSGKALLGLISDILDFSKIEAGKLELEAINFNLRESLAHMLKPLVFRAGQKQLELLTEVAPEVPEQLVGDPLRLRQILINFADNAIKFTQRGSVTVKVTAEAAGEGEQCLHFAVTDTGIGIPDEKQALIFEAFAQVDGSTTRNYGGTGLGLAIASQLIEQMRGKVWIESKVGEGTTFHFTACFGVASQSSSLSSSSSISPTDSRTKDEEEDEHEGRGLRILLAEDNVINRALADAILTRQGHTLVHAKNGCEAVTAAKTDAFDAILMDVQMPEMDGFEATRLIREIEEPLGRHTSIVAMTAHAMTGDRERCLAAGMDDYISKPLDKSELLALLERTAAARRRDAALPAAPVLFSRERLLDELDGDEELMENLIALFQENTPRLLDDIRGSIDRKSPGDLARSSHALLSSLGAFGATGARNLTQQLEAQANDENYEPNHRTFAALERETTAIHAALAEFSRA